MIWVMERRGRRGSEGSLNAAIIIDSEEDEDEGRRRGECGGRGFSEGEEAG